MVKVSSRSVPQPSVMEYTLVLNTDDTQRLRAIFKRALRGAGAAGADEGNSTSKFARELREKLDTLGLGENGFKDEARDLRFAD